MSGDDHGHGSGHGHDEHAGPSDIIPLGSWQDKFLAVVSLWALAVLGMWGYGFTDGITVHAHGQHHAGPAQHHGEPEAGKPAASSGTDSASHEPTSTATGGHHEEAAAEQAEKSAGESASDTAGDTSGNNSSDSAATETSTGGSATTDGAPADKGAGEH